MSEATGTADILARRRLAAADLGFFTSSASNFHPKPYNPSASSSSPVPHPPNTRTHLANPAPPPDPTPSDPSAVFIHPPFTSFPDAHHYPGGLTYQVMAANQEWFLDPNDFVFPGSTNPNAITYPSQLEPPRGWCPTKKKDLKERGSGNWPEGEEPKLRCTFCRRFYSGVNAKSMWRRHVFEKHKIAMANRRDTVDRTRKGVSKENKSAQGKENQTSARGMRKEVVPSSPQPTAKPKFRSLRPAAEAAAAASSFHDRASSYDDSMDEDAPPVPSAPRIPQEEFPAYRPLGPPLSRGSSQTSATPPPDSPEQDADAFESQIIIRPSPVDDDLDLDDAPPTPTRHTIPSSPYDPKATPSFRHSPARLPSDQPWRFPSPNHPLHCMTEISLSQVTVAPPSPTAIGSHAIDASPVIIAPRKDRSSVFNTPTLAREHGTLSRPTPRHLFPLSGETPASMTDRFKKSFRPTEESPLRYSNFTPRHSKFSDSLDSSSDPFSFDSPLRLNGMASTPTTSPESDSPVMRTSRLMEPLLGPNGERQPSLLAPFSLKRELERDDDDEKDDDDDDDGDSDTLGYQYSGRLHLASPVSRVRLTQSRSYSNSLKGSPTTSRESSSSNDSHLHLRKRRRTLAD